VCMRDTDCRWNVFIIVYGKGVVSYSRLPKCDDLNVFEAVIRLEKGQLTKINNKVQNTKTTKGI